MKTIVVVEDDIEIGNAIETLLNLEGYAVRRAFSGTEALMLLSQVTPDLVLLDLNLPGLNGEDVLKQIKAGIPVIILSAKSATRDKVNNLIAGASDYITKPFDNDELLARIAVQLRHNAADSSDTVKWKNIELDKQTFSVTAAGNTVKLTKTEFAILQLFMTNPKNVFSKSAIVENISDYTLDGEESSISVHISSLRHKLAAAANQEYIETVWGIGFKLIP